MPNRPRRRTLVTFTEAELILISSEAEKKGLKLATYIRSIVIGAIGATERRR